MSGCGTSANLSGLVPGQGTVFYEGAPLAGATVTFHPVQQSEIERAASAITDSNGQFKLMTLQPNDGVLPGEYTVTVLKMKTPEIDAETQRKIMYGELPPQPQLPPEHLVNVKYTDVKTSGINFTVGPKGDKNIEVRLVK
ncbi:MAG: carboxypeptidase-like regulatory domain-containing protein [Planctomycetaceae bacterium]|nr:carboxypeptidase-like regulatory domain-containing protein [Planctomycetaceae bacterium]